MNFVEAERGPPKESKEIQWQVSEDDVPVWETSITFFLELKPPEPELGSSSLRLSSLDCFQVWQQVE